MCVDTNRYKHITTRTRGISGEHKIVKTGVEMNDARDLTRSFENVKKVNGLVELQTWAEKGLSCKPESESQGFDWYIYDSKSVQTTQNGHVQIGVFDRLNSDQRNYAATDGEVDREIFFRMKEIYGETRLSQDFALRSLYDHFQTKWEYS